MTLTIGTGPFGEQSTGTFNLWGLCDYAKHDRGLRVDR